MKHRITSKHNKWCEEDVLKHIISLKKCCNICLCKETYQYTEVYVTNLNWCLWNIIVATDFLLFVLFSGTRKMA